jgi:uncharacterized membrane protein YoaT (DUF817 family)
LRAFIAGEARYPSQSHGWALVSPERPGSWFLLMLISYTLVSLINAPLAFVARKTGEAKLETV